MLDGEKQVSMVLQNLWQLVSSIIWHPGIVIVGSYVGWGEAGQYGPPEPVAAC